MRNIILSLAAVFLFTSPSYAEEICRPGDCPKAVQAELLPTPPPVEVSLVVKRSREVHHHSTSKPVGQVCHRVCNSPPRPVRNLLKGIRCRTRCFAHRAVNRFRH